jgi:hypothetical protein
MATTIREDVMIDQTPVVRLENEFLQVDVAPTVGGRIVNLVEKGSNHQFLWHNARLKLEKLPAGSEYDPNFYGGIDELLPGDIPVFRNRSTASTIPIMASYGPWRSITGLKGIAW